MTQLLAGIDLGGTTINLVLGNSDGTIVRQKQIPTESHDGPPGVLDRICLELGELKGDSALASIGMGVPGLVDIEQGITRFLPNLPTQWRDIPVAETLSERMGCPARLLNDVRTATLGELVFGHGKGRPGLTMAFFSIGTGIGGGVVVDGRLRLGPNGSAGELGHQTIDRNGPRCGCGNNGCLETLASGPAIAAEGVRLMKMGLAPTLFSRVNGEVGKVNTREMIQVIDEDPAIREAIENAAKNIGIGVSNVMVMLHPELIVLGGGVAEMGSLLIKTVQQVVQERIGMFPVQNVEITNSKLGESAGVLGAVALAAQGIQQASH